MVPFEYLGIPAPAKGRSVFLNTFSEHTDNHTPCSGQPLLQILLHLRPPESSVTMLRVYSRSSDDRRRTSGASFSSGRSSNMGLDTTSARSTYRTTATDYSDDPAVEDIGEDVDVVVSRLADPTYGNPQPFMLVGPPYPSNNQSGHEPMETSDHLDAYHWMTSDGQPDDHARMRESIEALPSTTPPQHVPEEPTGGFGPYGETHPIGPENTRRGKKKQRNNSEPLGIYHDSSCEPEAAALGTDMMFQEAQTYGSGCHFFPLPVNTSRGLHAAGMVSPYHHHDRYPGCIDPSDLGEPQRRTEVEDTDWEVIEDMDWAVVESHCNHDSQEQFYHCLPQRFAFLRNW